MFHSLCANGIKKECKNLGVKYGCWQFDFICIIPFILKWPYNIYSIRIYVLSIFGMVNGLSISFLNSRISFFIVPLFGKTWQALTIVFIPSLNKVEKLPTAILWFSLLSHLLPLQPFFFHFPLTSPLIELLPSSANNPRTEKR